MTDKTAQKCRHDKLRPASGGFYVTCSNCGQTWVARRRGGAKDTDLDHGPHATCFTSLSAVSGGAWVWTED